MASQFFYWSNIVELTKRKVMRWTEYLAYVGGGRKCVPVLAGNLNKKIYNLWMWMG